MDEYVVRLVSFGEHVSDLVVCPVSVTGVPQSWRY
jgi:hypothetical protein